MLKTLGACLVIAGTTAGGLAAASVKRRQVRCLAAFITALDRIRREIAERNVLLPDIFRQLGKSSPGKVGEMFLFLLREMSACEYVPLSDLWDSAVRQLLSDLPNTVLEEAAGVGEFLGRYDQHEQAASISAVTAELRAQLEALRREAGICAKTGGAVGVSAGVMAVLCLI